MWEELDRGRPAEVGRGSEGPSLGNLVRGLLMGGCSTTSPSGGSSALLHLLMAKV